MWFPGGDPSRHPLVASGGEQSLVVSGGHQGLAVSQVSWFPGGDQNLKRLEPNRVSTVAITFPMGDEQGLRPNSSMGASKVSITFLVDPQGISGLALQPNRREEQSMAIRPNG